VTYFFAHFFAAACAGVAWMLAGSLALHLVCKSSQRRADIFCRAPVLDATITYFFIGPIVLGAILAHWTGVVGAVTGQVAGILLWVQIHEAIHADAVRGPRIVKVLNHIIGPWRNHAALWLTAAVTPIFWLVRMVEIFFYPLLRRLVGFPKYNDADWVNVSRQKFQGLVGHDLIWCLYCDWMTGVWSLGTEMLRNVESFWCPIRFDNEKKCENCKIDFPDVDNGWIPETGTMAEVADLVADQHRTEPRAWFGHPTRLTVKGRLPS
jgi:hypothetical protein